MANQTVNAFALLIAAQHGVDTANTNFITEIERRINKGIKKILEVDWPWRYTSESINTVAGTANYSLATTAQEIVAVRIPALDVHLSQTTAEDLAESDYDMEQSGQPRWWYNLGYDVSNQKVTVGLFPVPDATYAITFYEWLRAIDIASATNIPFPEDMRGALHEIVDVYMLEGDKDYVGAAKVELRFNHTMKLLKRKYFDTSMPKKGAYVDVPTGSRRFPGFPANYPGRPW